MANLVVLLLAFTVANAKLLAPRDLVDEVEDNLEQLDTLVQTEILRAHDELKNLTAGFANNTADVAEARAAALDQEHDSVNVQLNKVKDRGVEANADISRCFNVREDALNRLPDQYKDEINSCIDDLNDEANRIATNARYLIDVVINKVHQLVYQLEQCEGNLLCISPLVYEIELNKIRLPQNIKAEVQATEALLNTLELSGAGCAQGKLDEYVQTADGILSSIISCVDGILEEEFI